jgi:hypothetical protein
MKKRIQVTVGPSAAKLLVKVARKTNLETGLSVTAVDVLEAAATVGLNTMLPLRDRGGKALTKLRE